MGKSWLALVGFRLRVLTGLLSQAEASVRCRQSVLQHHKEFIVYDNLDVLTFHCSLSKPYFRSASSSVFISAFSLIPAGVDELA